MKENVVRMMSNVTDWPLSFKPWRYFQFCSQRHLTFPLAAFLQLSRDEKPEPRAECFHPSGPLIGNHVLDHPCHWRHCPDQPCLFELFGPAHTFLIHYLTRDFCVSNCIVQAGWERGRAGRPTGMQHGRLLLITCCRPTIWHWNYRYFLLLF